MTYVPPETPEGPATFTVPPTNTAPLTFTVAVTNDPNPAPIVVIIGGAEIPIEPGGTVEIIPLEALIDDLQAIVDGNPEPLAAKAGANTQESTRGGPYCTCRGLPLMFAHKFTTNHTLLLFRRYKLIRYCHK